MSTSTVPALEGLPVPDFSASCTGQSPFTLSAERGRRVILYFYPKDNTPGCTTEASLFRDAYPSFLAANTRIMGVSRDTLKSHENFRTKLALPFDLIADPDEVLCEMFGVMKMKNMYGKQVRGIERSTFVIDGNGILVKEWRGIKVPGHVEECLKFVTSFAS